MLVFVIIFSWFTFTSIFISFVVHIYWHLQLEFHILTSDRIDDEKEKKNSVHEEFSFFFLKLFVYWTDQQKKMKWNAKMPKPELPRELIFQRHHFTFFSPRFFPFAAKKKKKKEVNARKRDKFSKNFQHDSRKFHRNSMNLKLHT